MYGFGFIILYFFEMMHLNLASSKRQWFFISFSVSHIFRRLCTFAEPPRLCVHTQSPAHPMPSARSRVYTHGRRLFCRVSGIWDDDEVFLFPHTTERGKLGSGRVQSKRRLGKKMPPRGAARKALEKVAVRRLKKVKFKVKMEAGRKKGAPSPPELRHRRGD